MNKEKPKRRPNLFFPVLCLFWRKPPQSCGCVHRSRSWWGQRCRSSPGRWRGTRGSLCRRTWRRRSSPSGRDESLLPWCCRRIPGHHRNLLPLLQCSAATITLRLRIMFGFYCTLKTFQVFQIYVTLTFLLSLRWEHLLDEGENPTLSAPQISTTSDSSTTVTRKLVVCISSFSIGPQVLSLQPASTK